MNDAPLTFILSQNTSREQRRMQLEREHPDGLSCHEMREAMRGAPTLKMHLQSLVSNLRKPTCPAPASRTYTKPVANCSPQA
jgi:hypothetical protein